MDSPKIAKDVWNQCLEIIREDIKEQTYNTWFKPVIPLEIIDQRLVIQVPSQFFYEWIEGHYNALVNKSIKTILGQDAKLVYKVEITDDESDKQISLALSENRDTPAKSISIKNELPPVVDSNLKSQYTFDTFITGDNNQLARAAALNIAANPGGTSFNPIVIYGNVGLGKTHLIQAIGNEVLKRFNNKRVMYTSSEKFTVDFVDSLAENKTNEFSNFYKSMDVLIVDDIQFFAGKEKTQDIFFHTFNTLHQHNKQIVLSSDRPPRDLKGIPERLISRFQWGLTADIQLPDLETRTAILKKKSESMGMEIPAEIIDYIAMSITSNIRELEGALIGLLAESSISNKEITLDLAREIVKKNSSSSGKKNITIDTIQKIVCEYYDISEDLLRDKTRKQEIALPRQIAMYLSKELTKFPLKTIGLHFGGRDHTTVIHAHKCISDLKASDDKFKRELEDVRKKIETLF